MIRKTLLGALMLVVLGSTAWAQTPKVEFTGLIGWTLSDGVSGDPVTALDGKRLRPGGSPGFGQFRVLARVLPEPVGRTRFPVAPAGHEARRGRHQRRHPRRHEHRRLPRLRRVLLRRPRSRRPVRTSWAASARPTTAACPTRSWTASRPRRESGTQFSTTWGAGLKVQRVAERRHEVRHPVDADLHQVGRGRLVVRPVVGLLRDRRRPVREPVRVRRRSLVPLLEFPRARSGQLEQRREGASRSPFLFRVSCSISLA